MTSTTNQDSQFDSADSTDIEITAGSTVVSGTVTDQVDASRLEGANIVLYPVAERDAVTVTGSMNGDTLEWSTDIQPGGWVVVVTGQTLANGGGVAIGLLDASVSDGGNISMVMALGGYVDLSTAWTDIEQGDHHAGASDPESATLIQEDVQLEVTFDDIAWMVDLQTKVACPTVPRGNRIV